MKKAGLGKQTSGGGSSELRLQCAFRAMGHREDNGNLRLSSIFCGFFYFLIFFLNSEPTFTLSTIRVKQTQAAVL